MATNKELREFMARGMENIHEPKQKRESGFFDLPLPKGSVCLHPEHNPPGHIYIPPGKGYHHVCPACGAETDLVPTQITY